MPLPSNQVRIRSYGLGRCRSFRALIILVGVIIENGINDSGRDLTAKTMVTSAIQHTRLVFWLKLLLGLSAAFLFLVIFVFSYSRKVEPAFKVITKDYDQTVFIEEALHRLVEIYYILGLESEAKKYANLLGYNCLLYTSPSPLDATLSRMPSSA